MTMVNRLHFASLAAFLALAPAAYSQQQQSPPPSPQTPTAVTTAVEDDPQARAIIRRMAEHLAQAQHFSVSIRASYDVVQNSGETFEFGENRTVTLSRPDRLRIETQESDGHRELVIYDGKALSMADVDANAYGQIEIVGTLDQTIRSMVRDIGVRLPLAMLLVSTLPAELDRRIQSATYVERNMLTGVPIDHLAAQAESVDFQAWVEAGETPLLRRVVITYKTAEGKPQYRADLSDWNFSPDVSPALFTFTPPADYERLPILVTARRDAVGQSDGDGDAFQIPKAAGAAGGSK